MSSVRLEPNDLNTGNSGQGKVLHFEAHHPQHQDSRYLRRLRALSPSHRGNLHRRKKFFGNKRRRHRRGSCCSRRRSTDRYRAVHMVISRQRARGERDRPRAEKLMPV